VNDRPPIPADLRRRILVEAGHRCAIHTCKHPEVDVHHIIPWEKCKEHDYDNLVALCPNCHRRADAGEIDRSSLRLYKARLVASFGLSDPLVGTKSTPSDNGGSTLISHWRTETICERWDDYPSYEAQLEFPSFTDTGPDLTDLNVLERSEALRRLSELRSLRLLLPPVDHGPLSKMSSQLTSSYEVSCYTGDIVSIRYSIFHYGAGAAHPNHVSAVTNVQMRPMFSLVLADLFRGKSGYLETISDYCISRLAEAKGLAQPSDWILRGAGPDLKNFSRFNVTPVGLLITFDEYQVDCYAAGGSQVLIAKGLLTEYLNPACSVIKVWTGSGATGRDMNSTISNDG
jgi:HNH endonuclease/Protein of unknown function (DUF3298)